MPRSILKQSSSSSSDSYSTTSLAAALPYPPPPPQVHFPPPTSLTQTHYTHSGTHYDRAPIVVLPNDCALPERGCPGRTYDNSSGYKTPRPATLTSKCGRTPHPRAAEASADGRISRCNLVYPQNASSSSMMMTVKSRSGDSIGRRRTDPSTRSGASRVVPSTLKLFLRALVFSVSYHDNACTFSLLVIWRLLDHNTSHIRLSRGTLY